MQRSVLTGLILILIAWQTMPAFSQEREAVGEVEPAQVQDLLDKRLPEIRAVGNWIGFGAGVMVDGEVVALSVDGMRWSKGGPLSVEDKWHLGSVTKSMTAMLAALLVEDGVISFDASLPELLPDMAEEMHPEWRNVTLRHLLTHTSTLAPNFPMRTQSIWPKDAAALTEERRKWIARTLKNPPRGMPGKNFVYSNLGYTVAGFAAAEAAGVPYEQLITERLFVPAGLSSAGFGAPEGDQPRGHQQFFGMSLARDPQGKGSDNTPLIGPAGRAHITLTDFLKYGQLHLGENGLFSDETLTELHTPVERDYAMGLVVQEAEWAGGEYVWHNGSNTMWYALMIVLPEKDAVLVFTANDGRKTIEQAFFALAKEIALTLPQKTPTLEE